MFKLAKSKKVSNEKVDIRCITYKETNNKVHEYKDYLDVNITGNLGKEKYILHFIITKIIDEYLEMKDYQTLELTNNDVMDSYLVVGEKEDYSLDIDKMMINKFSNSISFNCLYRSSDKFYGSIEFEVDLDMIKEEISNRNK